MSRAVTAVLSSLLLVILSTSCDSSEADSELCPRQASVGEVDYFPPPTVGDVLHFDYSYSYGYPESQISVDGEMTWTITEAVECAKGKSTFRGTEDITGEAKVRSVYPPFDTTYFVDWRHRSLQITIGDSVRISNYTTQPFRRFYSEDSPDLLEIGARWSNDQIRDRRATLASGLPSGVYFYRLQARDYVETKRMVVVR